MTAREIMTADRFQIGLFSLNASAGIAMTKVPERWRGYGGESDPCGVCMETMTHTAALAGAQRTPLFTTAQTSILHPT
jgi:dimethylsulfone monooxygenase